LPPEKTTAAMAPIRFITVTVTVTVTVALVCVSV
jgi:hypothetical protein